MNLLLQELPASELSPKTIQESPPPGTAQDPLIAHGLQKEQYVGIIGLATPSLSLLDLLVVESNTLFYFAIFLSTILIALFLFI
jgi:hypothetical protein